MLQVSFQLSDVGPVLFLTGINGYDQQRARMHWCLLLCHKCSEIPSLRIRVLKLRGFVMNLCDLTQLCPSSKQKNCTTQCWSVSVRRNPCGWNTPLSSWSKARLRLHTGFWSVLSRLCPPKNVSSLCPSLNVDLNVDRGWAALWYLWLWQHL